MLDEFKTIVDENVRGIDDLDWDCCPNCGGIVEPPAPGKKFYCPHCGWHLPEEKK